MTTGPRSDRLDWDEWNLGHIRKHAVRPEEAEEVFGSRPVVRETYKQRLQLIGLTLSGRMLTVVIGPVPHQPGAYYVFSARPASRKERKLYDEHEGGSIS